MTNLQKVLFLGLLCGQSMAQNLQKIEAVKFSDVEITDTFWKPKMDKVATATLQACIVQTEVKTPRIRNFEKVARKLGEKHEGIYFDDSDVYKAIEAMAYSLKNHPDTDLEKKTDEWIDKIAAAQLPDGYLNTYYTLNGLQNRWTDMEKHEDYCAGHLMEAAVAYYNTTGKRKLLDVAIRFANHIDETFRLANRPWVSGHQEIELALVKLYRTTKDERYLKLSEWFLNQRGRGNGKGVIWDDWKDPAYCQDAVPVKDQKEITGHAVRAMYLYTGAADVAVNTGDTGYMNAMKTVWEDVVHRNMYITGGIGSSGSNEGFSQDFDLPNENAYCETCASVGMIFWNQRMNALTGESKYIDVLERSLYNGALDGLSLTGDRFFYGNPLASTGRHARREWFGTACCPSNIARLVSSIGDYIYGKSESRIWVNLFVGSRTNIKLGQTEISTSIETNYPLDGKVKISMSPSVKTKYALHIRIPSWATNVPVAGNLYYYLGTYTSNIIMKVNGKKVDYQIDNGYAVIEREWSAGDVVSFDLPMEVRKIVARTELKQDNDRVALQRGPLVYCVEGIDNGGKAWDFIVPDNAKFTEVYQKVLTESIVAIQTEATTFKPTADGLGIKPEKKKITAIPYYTWCNRGSGQMQVWLPRKVKNAMLNY
ncbi:MAG TPA: beta-L-arabinofuranosidase domain-containing protein [Leadbetterella sp.]|nr:beta-L-arabinofuranosidase domain-containing protein [Leadbetterella sp.]